MIKRASGRHGGGALVLAKSITSIHSKKFDNDNLNSVTISETDRYYQGKSTIIAKEANISSGIIPGPRRQVNIGLEYLF